MILDERQVCVYDLRSIVARLSDRADELIGVAYQAHVDPLANVLHGFAVERVREQFVQ